MVSTTAFHARVRGPFPGPGGLKETQMFLPHPLVKLSIVGSLCDREVTCSASSVCISNLVSGGQCHLTHLTILRGGGPRVVVSTAAFHARVQGSVPGLGSLKETKKMFLPHPRVKVSIVGSLRDREVACSASDSQGSRFESCVWRTVSSQSSHHPQEVLLAQFSLYVHKGGLKPDSFHFHFSPSSGGSLSPI